MPGSHHFECSPRSPDQKYVIVDRVSPESMFHGQPDKCCLHQSFTTLAQSTWVSPDSRCRWVTVHVRQTIREEVWDSTLATCWHAFLTDCSRPPVPSLRYILNGDKGAIYVHAFHSLYFWIESRFKKRLALRVKCVGYLVSHDRSYGSQVDVPENYKEKIGLEHCHI